MTKRDITGRINLLKKYLTQAKKYMKLSARDLTTNDEKRLATERALFLVAQSSIDLMEAYCVIKNFRQPSSMHEAVEILRENSVIDQKLCEALLKMVGFGNVLTHGYTKIDYSKVSDVLKSGLKDIKKLIETLG